MPSFNGNFTGPVYNPQANAQASVDYWLKKYGRDSNGMIEQFAKDAGVELVPWQKDLLTKMIRAVERGETIGIMTPHHWGRTNVQRVLQKYIEAKEAIMASDPVLERVNTWTKGWSKKQLREEIARHIGNYDGINAEKDKADRKIGELVVSQIRNHQQIDELNKRVSWQRKELRRLNGVILRRRAGNLKDHLTIYEVTETEKPWYKRIFA